MNFKKQLQLAFAILTITVGLAAAGLVSWVLQLNNEITVNLAEKRFQPPVEFYSAPEVYFKGQKITYLEALRTITRQGFEPRSSQQRLIKGSYSEWTLQECAQKIVTGLPSGAEKCLAYRGTYSDQNDKVLVFANDTILETYSGDPLKQVTVVELEPELFAQFYNNQPILRRVVSLGDTPPNCLNALLSIEDSNFLEHKGFSVTAIGRAILTNLRSGRKAQGGSTITQQLIKNYFLTHEKTFKRKLNELLMAILLEFHASKDEILEAYINEIYMGQNGSFQVHGFGAASQHYFGKKIENLELHECALLAAIVNSPGKFNPFQNPQNAKERRTRVLERMKELGKITEEESKQSQAQTLPSTPNRALSEPPSYFVDAVQTEMKQKQIDTAKGIKVFTTLNIRAQEAAQRVLSAGVKNLESTFAHLKKNKENGKDLEGALLSVDPTNGFVQAMVGGRSYRMSQFNRAIQSHRQVGSIMKPIVYLTALESRDRDGKPYHPLTRLSDSRFTVKYEGQEWSPDNYDNEFFGEVPMYFALKSSLNAATAKLALDIGLSNIMDLAKRLGAESELKAFPSLSLGAFELYPYEVLQMYSTLARMGEYTPITYIDRVESLSGLVLFQHTIEKTQVAAKENVATLVSMMKQTVLNGTGAAIPKLGFTHPAAGKTGTTSDNKDAWFAGFTPFHVAVVWIGYDDNTKSGLTGASGPVPIWTEYMKQYATQYPALDFNWPEGTKQVKFSASDLRNMGVPESEKRPLTDIELTFVKGTEP